MLIHVNTLNFPVTSVLMGVLVHSFTLLVVNYLVKKSLLLFETTHARDKFQPCNYRVVLRFIHANVFACRMFVVF